MCREKSTIQFYTTILLLLSLHNGTALMCPGVGVWCCAYTYPHSQGNSLQHGSYTGATCDLSDFTHLSPWSPTEGTMVFVHCLTYILNFNSQRKSKWRLVF